MKIRLRRRTEILDVIATTKLIRGRCSLNLLEAKRLSELLLEGAVIEIAPKEVTADFRRQLADLGLDTEVIEK